MIDSINKRLDEFIILFLSDYSLGACDVTHVTVGGEHSTVTFNTIHGIKCSKQVKTNQLKEWLNE